MSQQYTREDGVYTLMQIVIHHARNGTLEDIKSTLADGPGGRRPSEQKMKWTQWYRESDEVAQDIVHEIVTQAIDDTLFSIFAILDRAAGGLPIKDKLSDFALYLQTYEDADTENKDLPTDRIKLNPVDADTDLHDIFRWKLEEMTSKDNSQQT